MKMTKAALVFLAGIFSTLIVAWCYLVYGGMPVGTKGEPVPFEKMITKKALHFAMRDAVQLNSPVDAGENNLIAGAKIYRNECAICHGFPGEGPTNMALGMFPKPPQLLPPHKGVTNDPIGEIYWKVKNGIRLTGMPRYDETLSETEIWQVSLMLLHANKLSPAIQQDLQRKK